jgi:hypothetical protein
MDSQGIIKRFDSPELAKLAGFDTILTDEEVEVLAPLPVADRHAALKRLREAEARRKVANTAKRRDKNRAARKARRLQRDR